MLLKILLNDFSRKHGNMLPGKIGEYVQSKNLKHLCLDICLKLEIKMLIIKLFLLDVDGLAHNRLY